jgi:hypothetical protein
MDMNDLFKMLAEEKAKNSAEEKKKKNKTKKKSEDLKQDFLEAFSSELKQLKEQEENQKREIAAMEAWLTSPTVKEEVQPQIVSEDIEETFTEDKIQDPVE